MFVGDGGQCRAQVGVRVDSVQLAAFNKRGHAVLGVAALVMAREERVLAIEGYGSDGVFDRVGAHLDAPIGQEDV